MAASLEAHETTLRGLKVERMKVVDMIGKMRRLGRLVRQAVSAIHEWEPPADDEEWLLQNSYLLRQFVQHLVDDANLHANVHVFL